ncbi:MAG: hypothetical protein AB9M60_07480 [Leptothrix sp. (in: b-proteobacteria)]
MLNTRKKFMACLAVAAACAAVPSVATAEGDGPLGGLTAQWWQWALSIPSAQNPLTDDDGSRCMIGQRGPYWFLAGGFFQNAPIVRHCNVPEGATLFFPAMNYGNIAVPACDGVVQTVADLRAGAKQFMDTVTDVKVTLDHHPIPVLGRMKSRPFSVVMPQGDLFSVAFNLDCVVPGQVYSPAVDDGIYAMVTDLSAGKHTLRIKARNAAQGLNTDTTYHLTVVETLP